MIKVREDEAVCTKMHYCHFLIFTLLVWHGGVRSGGHVYISSHIWMVSTHLLVIYLCSALFLFTCDSCVHVWFSLWNSMVNKTKWMTLGLCPSTYYRSGQDGFDISNTLSDSRKKKNSLIEAGVLRRQNINFLIALCFRRSKCQWHRAHAVYRKPWSFPFFILEMLWALFWLHTEEQM